MRYTAKCREPVNVADVYLLLFPSGFFNKVLKPCDSFSSLSARSESLLIGLQDPSLLQFPLHPVVYDSRVQFVDGAKESDGPQIFKLVHWLSFLK